jgi:hypothetical protein
VERLKGKEVKVDQNSYGKKFTNKLKCSECRELEAEALRRKCKMVVQADKMNGDIDKLREKCKCLAALVKKVKQSRYRPGS